MQKESKFQHNLIVKIKSLFPGCVVLKNDPNYIQGMSDLIVLYNDNWAVLECKRESTSSHRVNQEYWVNKLNNMSYASFIFPENEGEVLNELQSALGSKR